MVETVGEAERTEERPGSVLEMVRVEAFRQSERARMARTLAHMLRIARVEARKRATPSQERMRWVNTVAYLTQTYNSLLRDTEVNELKEQMIVLQEKLNRIARTGHQ